MALGEFDLIERLLRRPQDAQRGRVVLGGGDDCALLQVQAGEHWAVSTDARRRDLAARLRPGFLFTGGCAWHRAGRWRHHRRASEHHRDRDGYGAAWSGTAALGRAAG